MTDPIADMLTRIRNAQAVEKEFVLIPLSRLKKAIADVLKNEEYIVDYSIVEEQGFQHLKVILKYSNNIPAIRSLKRVSKPGCRIYAKRGELPAVLNNLGIAIISTSRGVMTNHEARKSRLGGEILCEIS